MKVTIGRIVICYGLPANGGLEHPAIVNRAWAENDTADAPVAINATVFPDREAPQCVTSTLMHDTKEAALAYYADQLEKIGDAGFKPHPVCYWPERV